MLSAERVAALVLSLALISPAYAEQRPVPSKSLTIVVIEGEDAINVIQQKSAVAPVVEVRDRNNQPVAGATVRFAIQGGRATFGGARTLTLTTNAAGRAAVTGMTPTGSGAFQITASAAFQGQTAAVTIAQTNVLTAAEAAGAAGGGLSASTIGIVAASAVAVAGGVIAATQVLSGGVSIYEGDFRIDGLQTVRQVQNNGVVSLICTIAISQSGEVRAEIEEAEDGTLTGTMSAKWNITEGSRTCPIFAASGGTDVSYGQATINGTAASFKASSIAPSDGVGFGAQAFSGTLSNGVIRGTWTLGPSGYTFASGGGALLPAGSAAVTLTK